MAAQNVCLQISKNVFFAARSDNGMTREGGTARSLWLNNERARLSVLRVIFSSYKHMLSSQMPRVVSLWVMGGIYLLPAYSNTKTNISGCIWLMFSMDVSWLEEEVEEDCSSLIFIATTKIQKFKLAVICGWAEKNWIVNITKNYCMHLLALVT